MADDILFCNTMIGWGSTLYFILFIIIQSVFEERPIKKYYIAFVCWPNPIAIRKISIITGISTAGRFALSSFNIQARSPMFDK